MSYLVRFQMREPLNDRPVRAQEEPASAATKSLSCLRGTENRGRSGHTPTADQLREP